MSRSHPCVLLGYPTGHKAYKVLNLVNKHVHITRDIVFFEDIFSLHSLSKPNAPSIPSYIPINSTYFLDLNFTLLSQNDDVSSN